jgi:four helix bundle protein
MKKSELEERLINFSVLIIELTGLLQRNYAGTHLTSQIIRSGTSSALNYGEAQSGESKNDFIHKMQIVLKELRETYVCLRIIKKSKLCKSEEKLEILLKENNELISIFVKSVETAKKNNNK